MTGVDRVEFAYLSHLLTLPAPLFGLVATGFGQSVLDRAGVAALRRRIAGNDDWGSADLIARLSRRKGPMRRRAESDVRRLSLATVSARGLGRLLQRVLPVGFAYLNTGHANLSEAAFAAVAWAEGRVMVLVHDTIPLDFPQFTRPGQSGIFAGKLQRVGARADLVIFNSAASKRDAERYFAGWGRVPPSVVAHLGMGMATLARPPGAGEIAAALPPGLDPDRPWFLCVGTIEPRKNHALLLDIWADLAATLPAALVPQLVILGGRGWMNREVFRRLDALPADSPVRELNGADDRMLAALLSGSAGLLFPSHAEGFGLPPLEAAACGIPVLCNDLPVIREVLGEYPVYAAVADRYLWTRTIMLLADGKRAGTGNGRRGTQPALPTWENHFNLVLSLT